MSEDRDCKSIIIPCKVCAMVIGADRHARIFSFREETGEIAINRTLAPIIPQSGAGPIN